MKTLLALLPLLLSAAPVPSSVPTVRNRLFCPAVLGTTSRPETAAVTKGCTLFDSTLGGPMWSPGDGGPWVPYVSGTLVADTCTAGSCVLNATVVTDGGTGGTGVPGFIFVSTVDQLNNVSIMQSPNNNAGVILFENGASDWALGKGAAGSAQGFALVRGSTSVVSATTGNDVSIPSGNFSCPNQITGSQITATRPSGFNAFEVTTNGGRVDFGSGANDYCASDGTTVSFAGPILATSYALDRTFASTGTPVADAGFGATGALAAHNGTIAFTVTIGTSPGTSMTFGLPTVTNGWRCTCSDVTTNTEDFDQSAFTTNSCTMKAYARTTGIGTAPTAADTLICTATSL